MNATMIPFQTREASQANANNNNNSNPESVEANTERESQYGYEELMMDRYSQMYEDFKQTIIGEYFASDSLNRNGDIYDWHDENGFKFSKKDPLGKYMENSHLRTVRIPSNHRIPTQEEEGFRVMLPVRPIPYDHPTTTNDNGQQNE